MTPQEKNCSQCKKAFPINSEDLKFYQKVNVPTPTFCPECRMIRRLMFRNERSWHKTTCDATGKSLLSMFAPEKNLTIYELNYWKSDNWDPLIYGREYDFSKPFFSQFRELFKTIPHPNLVQKNNVGSDYSNYTLNQKNCYYCASSDGGEDNCYTFTLMLRNRQCVDSHMCNDCERSYEATDCSKSSGLRFCHQCDSCVDSWLLYDCRNCQNCVGCVGLRGKSYCIFNEQYSKEEYKKKIKELSLSSRQGLDATKILFEKLKLQVPRKFAAVLNSKNVIGDDIRNSQNVQGFTIKDDCQDVRYSYRVEKSRDIWDGFVVWGSSEMQYETMSCQSQRTYFSALIWGGFDIQYSYNCFDCNNIFGCIGLRNKSYCILNKQYSKEEYESLLPKVIEQMYAIAYVDRHGIEYRYGEFFPTDLSPFAYNETINQDYFPLKKEEVINQGFTWRDPDARSHKVTMVADSLPDSITDAPETFVNEIIECAHAGKECNEQCAGAFKMIPLELQYYRRWGVPLPRLCPSCRHFGRVKLKPQLKMFEGVCKKCASQFHTPYPPNTNYTLYCEGCYNAEII